MVASELRIGGCYTLTSTGESCQITHLTEGPMPDVRTVGVDGPPIDIVAQIQIIHSDDSQRLGHRLLVLPGALGPLVPFHTADPDPPPGLSLPSQGGPQMDGRTDAFLRISPAGNEQLDNEKRLCV